MRGENSSFLAMHRNNAALLLQIFLLPVATLAFAWPPTLNTLPASGNVHSIHQSLFVQRGSLKGVRYCRNNDFSAHQSSQCRSSNTLPLFALGTSSGSFEHTPQNTLRGGVNQQGAFRSSFTSAPLIASPSGRVSLISFPFSRSFPLSRQMSLTSACETHAGRPSGKKRSPHPSPPDRSCWLGYDPP